MGMDRLLPSMPVVVGADTKKQNIEAYSRRFGEYVSQMGLYYWNGRMEFRDFAFQIPSLRAAHCVFRDTRISLFRIYNSYMAKTGFPCHNFDGLSLSCGYVRMYMKIREMRERPARSATLAAWFSSENPQIQRIKTSIIGARAERVGKQENGGSRCNRSVRFSDLNGIGNFLYYAGLRGPERY